VRDIMTKEILTVDPEDGLDLIARLFEKYDYDGLPVVSKDRKLLGIITEYDMVTQSLGMHLPTVIAILDKIAVNQADKKDLDAHFQKLRETKAKQIMNVKPLAVSQDENLEVAAKLFADHHRVNPLCVVDGTGLLTGVLSRYDVIRFFNERYLQQVVQDGATSIKDPFSDIKTKSQLEIESAVGDLSKEFLLVTKKRPTAWKVIAAAAFIAGLLAATALIIRLVEQGDSYNYLDHSGLALSTLSVPHGAGDDIMGA